MIVTAATYISSNHYSFSDNENGLDSIRHWSSIGLPLAKKHQLWKYYFELKKILTNAYIFTNSFEFALEEARDMAKEAERLGNERIKSSLPLHGYGLSREQALERGARDVSEGVRNLIQKQQSLSEP